jgi:hypothetical protein
MSTVIRPKLSYKNTWFVPKHRYYELKHFCLQYPDWKKCYLDCDMILASSLGYDIHVTPGKPADTTAMFAQARLYWRERMDLVEKAAKEAGEDLWEMLLASVTEGLSYTKLSPPCCKEVWFRMYRKFFWLLDKARK